MKRIKTLLVPIFMQSFTRYRKEHRLSQEQMARLLGVAVRSYIDLEHGNSLPATLTLIAFLSLVNEEGQRDILHPICGVYKQTIQSEIK